MPANVPKARRKLEQAHAVLTALDCEIRGIAPPVYHSWASTLYGHIKQTAVALDQVEAARAMVGMGGPASAAEVETHLQDLCSYAGHLCSKTESFVENVRRNMAEFAQRAVMLEASLFEEFQRRQVTGVFAPQHLLTGAWRLPEPEEVFHQNLSRTQNRWIREASTEPLHKLGLVTARAQVIRGDSGRTEFGPAEAGERGNPFDHAEKQLINQIRARASFTPENVIAIVFVITAVPCRRQRWGHNSCEVWLERLAQDYQAQVLVHVQDEGNRAYGYST